MIIVISIFLAVGAFFLGFCAGKNRVFKKPVKAKRQYAEILKLRQEYENFLNYDGSQQ